MRIKSFLCLFLSILMLLSLCIPAFAAEEEKADTGTHIIYIEGSPKSVIHNEYFKLYYNDIFEAEYGSLDNYVLDEMTRITVESIPEEGYAYLTVILKEKPQNQSYKEYNEAVLKDAEILYAGDTRPMAVIKADKADALKLAENESVAAVFPGFFSYHYFMSDIMGSGKMGDVTGNDNVTAADARKVLRFSAGLEKIQKDEAKMFYIKGDMNFDNTVNAADARLILRTSANLEKETEMCFPYAAYWKDF